jgi:FixJ family two-component response regulator
MIGPSFRCGRGPAADGHVRATNTGHDYDDTLAGRELEVLRLLAAGRSNQRIARDLGVALDMVKRHVTLSWAGLAPPTGPRPPRGPASWA